MTCPITETGAFGGGGIPCPAYSEADNPSVKNFVFATSLYTREAVGFCNTSFGSPV